MTYEWIKTIEEVVEESKLIPLWGTPPPFPWEEAARKISESLAIPHLSFSPKKAEWKGKNEILVGMGPHPLVLALEFSPLGEYAYWVIALEDVAKLTACCLGSNNKGFSDPHFQEGFYHYLALETANTLNNLKEFSELPLKITPISPPDEAGLCVDVSISLNKHTIWGRLICPASFHQAFRTHFSMHRPSLLSSDLAKKVDVTLCLEIGNVNLKFEQWQTVKTGDLIILDRCTFDPKAQKGTLTIILEKTPLFRARFKANNIKLIDYAFYYEEPMEDTNSEDDPNKEEFSKEPHNEPFEGEKEEEPIEGEEHLWSPKNHEELSLEKILSVHEVSVPLVVELGKINMSIEKLLQLKPGNTIEFPLRADQSVDLTLHGKKIAKGELVKIGEAVGIKVIQISEKG
jgi:flagellar motor switch protein FliN